MNILTKIFPVWRPHERNDARNSVGDTLPFSHPQQKKGCENGSTSGKYQSSDIRDKDSISNIMENK
jgi:hypothetical protein